ncbi:phosphotransferase family protein [uncultured Nevskia sp.]|uniref:phosphotransferase family protein n=1 Tax=uncultured Nevskia sp. TaxID=228950 RepID=UPI0025EB1DF3|nr:phosphotransferase family protein [uncultured Nevskia sp.]
MARDLESMTRGLRSYLSDGARITRIVALSTGHSNETYLIEGIDRILRMPPSEEGLLPPYDMARQHAIFDAVGKAAGGPPVPRMYELCTDASVIGDPFFLMQRFDGEAFDHVAPDWMKRADADTVASMCSQWVGAVTALHRQPASLMPTGARSVAQEIAHWLNVAVQAEAEGGLIDLLEALRADPPAASGPMTPVHGDPKQGNCLWQGPRLQALLDWEMAAIGEPLTDLGYMLQFYDQGEVSFANAGFEIDGWWSREQVIDEWQRAAQRSARDLRRYEALALCKVTSIIALGHHLSRTGRATDPRFASWGAVVPLYLDLAQRRVTMQ